MGWVELGLTVD